ncbi:translocation/assembly module TamB domain-containing protein [Legionella resiliens]|uniref:Translocation/assembly module TamB domain-containing protein n=1 Tax=Legionella resiliens TaxID=2905958 RepID=A0ABS8X4N8_9GAMM|nr:MULTISPECIES: translocation/assembly module TamB domain-containing protein [unclassified Legionella]MCE0723393.1 translocation/assembly module TamB domain-containing protein [Legionella sp. 9fVS26]MCE3532547.1 translocation/assembly module TamB domain-containing protein [Legionella sp. 8cVS16]
MKRILIKFLRVCVKTLYISSLFLILLAGIVLFLLDTKPGLHTLIQFSRLYLPGTLKIQQLEGSILNHFTLNEIEYKDKSFKVTIEQFEVQWQPHSLRESQLVTARWKGLHWNRAKDKIIDSEKGTITATGVLPNMRINMHSQITTVPKDQWLMDATIRGTLPWQWTFNANLTQPQSSSAQHARLYTNLSTHGEITAKNQGNLLLTIHPGFYHDPNNDALPVVQFKGGSLKIILSPEQLKGSGILAIDENKNLKLQFNLPKFTLDAGLQDDQAINSELSLELNSLNFLEKISPEIDELKGQLIASLKVNGTLSKRKIESHLILSKTRLSLPKLGLNIDTLEMNVRGNERSWEATGSAASAGHYLLIAGKGSLRSQFTGDFTLEGNDFPLVQTSEYKINISPKLKLHLTPSLQSLSGTILVPYAEIKPRSFNNSVSLPDDVVYKHKEKTSPSFTLINNMDIELEMGKEVLVNAKGLRGHLDGTLNIKQQQSSINAYGELSVRDGTYKAYGQNLAIQQGQLTFGGPMNNPGINLRAAKKIRTTPTTFATSSQLLDFNSTNQNINYGETMILGVEATGRLSRPKIQLFSEPASLSQADILSLLVLGRPANQADKAGGQLLLAAISSMNLGSDTKSLQLLEQLKQTAGIDFNVQTNTNYNQLTNTTSDTTSFMVGKSLSKRLYLSYSIGLSQTDTNMLTLRYLLNKFFSIQVSNSDTSSAIDFLYTSNKKTNKIKKGKPSS